jgi:hypothetical protein
MVHDRLEACQALVFLFVWQLITILIRWSIIGCALKFLSSHQDRFRHGAEIVVEQILKFSLVAVFERLWNELQFTSGLSLITVSYDFYRDGVS